jgi:hypothetical protein
MTTTTSTADLQSALSAQRAAIDGQPAVSPDYIPPADARTGEIVSVPPQGDPPPLPNQGNPPFPGTAVAPAQPPPPPDYSMIPAKVLGGIPYATEYSRLSKTICNTEMVPGALRGRWDAVMAAFMRGYEMGLGPMQSLDSFNVIDGKVGLAAEAMRALTINAGHQIILEDVYAEDGTFVGTKADCHRADWSDGQWRTYRFTMDDARQAGLDRPTRSGRPSNYHLYPRAMCDARATSGACRRYFPDVLAGMSYTPEEIRDFDGPGEAQEAPPSAQDAPPQPQASGLESAMQPEQQNGQSSPPPSSPPPADAPAASSATAPESTPAAASTDSASATSPEAPAEPAPATASTSTAKKAGRSRKAAPKSSAAPTAPAPEATTPPDAPPPATDLVPTAAGDGSPTTPAAAPDTSSGSDSPGEAGVLRAMASGLVQIITALPKEQQPLCRAFLRQHYPDGIDTITDPGEMQAAVDIATGWPGSADTHPIPLRGEEVWGGFTTRVILSEGEYLTNCTICTWALEEPATHATLPEVRRLELAQSACQQHEQGAYEDGTPFCAGRPAQGQMAVD